MGRRNWKTGRTEISNLLPDEFLQSDTMQVLLLEAKIERSRGHRLIGWAVQLREERVRQRLFDGDTFSWMNLQHLPHEIQCILRCARELTT